MKRIKITDKHREIAREFPNTLANRMSCPVCDDDIVIHEWIDINDDGKIVACDRQACEPHLVIGCVDCRQYLVKCADGHDYARVEPWEGGLLAATAAAARIGGYVLPLDAYLCVPRGAEPVADYR